jgi:putative transposase
MDNHFHILIRPDEKVASLSEVMRWLKGNFAKAWNKAHGCKGHVWGERFFSRIIENMCDFARTMEYIDENPVKAGLVVRATDWVYGRLHKLKQGLTGVLDLIDVAPATL